MRRLVTSLQQLLSSIQPGTYTFMQISCLPCLTLTPLSCINSVEKACKFLIPCIPTTGVVEEDSGEFWSGTRAVASLVRCHCAEGGLTDQRVLQPPEL